MVYFIDTEALLTLQKLFNLFSYEIIGKRLVCIKKLDSSFSPLQYSKKYRKITLKLYGKIFLAWTPELLQKVCIDSNKLVTKLIAEFGDFTKDPAWDSIDTLDRLTLTDIAKSTMTK